MSKEDLYDAQNNEVEPIRRETLVTLIISEILERFFPILQYYDLTQMPMFKQGVERGIEILLFSNIQAEAFQRLRERFPVPLDTTGIPNQPELLLSQSFIQTMIAASISGKIEGLLDEYEIAHMQIMGMIGHKIYIHYGQDPPMGLIDPDTVQTRQVRGKRQFCIFNKKMILIGAVPHHDYHHLPIEDEEMNASLSLLLFSNEKALIYLLAKEILLIFDERFSTVKKEIITIAEKKMKQKEKRYKKDQAVIQKHLFRLLLKDVKKYEQVFILFITKNIPLTNIVSSTGIEKADQVICSFTVVPYNKQTLLFSLDITTAFVELDAQGLRHTKSHSQQYFEPILVTLSEDGALIYANEDRPGEFLWSTSTDDVLASIVQRFIEHFHTITPDQMLDNNPKNHENETAKRHKKILLATRNSFQFIQEHDAMHPEDKEAVCRHTVIQFDRPIVIDKKIQPPKEKNAPVYILQNGVHLVIPLNN